MEKSLSKAEAAKVVSNLVKVAIVGLVNEPGLVRCGVVAGDYNDSPYFDILSLLETLLNQLKPFYESEQKHL